MNPANQKNFDQEKQKINDQLAELYSDPIPGVSCWLIDETQPYKLQAMIDGPIGSVYEGGIFFLSINLSDGILPHLKPVTTFMTKIYHPSVNINSNGGHFCNEIICTYWDDCSSSWCKTGMTIRSMLLLLVDFFLIGQNVSEGLCCNKEAFELFQTNKELYDKTAREWTMTYAM